MSQIIEHPLVSIVAICHNHSLYVIETLDSIKNQTYPNIELIIINNLRDECESIIQKWIDANKDVISVFIQNDQPINVSQNCNLGLQTSKGEFLQLISCDDIMIEDKIEKQIKLFQEINNEKHALVFSNFYKINEKSEFIDRETDLYLPLLKENVIDQFANSFTINAPTVLLRRSSVIAVGGYREDLIIEDYYMWLELLRNGYFFESVNEPLIKYRILSNSLYQSRGYSFFNSLLIIYTKNIDPFFNGKNHKPLFYVINMYRRNGGDYNIFKILQIMRKSSCYNPYYLVRALLEPSIMSFLKK